MVMTPEIYLEDVGEIVTSKGGKNIWKVKNLSGVPQFKGRELPKTIYVVDFPGRGPGQELLLGRHICGPKKFLMIQDVCHGMMRLFKDQFTGRVAQFVILWGGRPLDLLGANPPLYEESLIDTTYIKLTRVEDKAASRGWRVVKSSMVGDWWKCDTWLVMEECIASGKTLQHFVEMGFSEHKPKKLFVFPVCASAEGLEGMNEVCERHGVEFVPVLNSAIIQVAEKGVVKPFTDLGLQPRTIVTKDFCNDLSRRYQGTPLCWVGDIGDSLYQVHEYLIETLSDMVSAGMDLEKEDFSIWNPVIRSKGFLEELERREKKLFNIFSSLRARSRPK